MSTTSPGRQQQSQAPPPILGRRGPPGRRGMEDVDRAKDTRGTVLRLWGYLRRQRGALVATTVMVVLTAVLTLLNPFLLGRAIDLYVLRGDLPGLARICLLMLGVNAAKSILTWLQAYVMAAASQRTVRDIRYDLFASLQTLSLRYFDQHSHGDLMSRATNDVENINTVLASSVVQLFSGVLTTVGVSVWFFYGVSFAYERDTPVLKHISLCAQPGQTVALVGPTGAGKTTIVNLLTRFYDIDAGRILIDDCEIRSIKIDELRSQLGIVLQDTFLFSRSVRENIRYGRLDASEEEILNAAVLANADQFIRRLPQGYDTPLSERAGNLSQGQRQLLAIARAILADPGILVLDEATSSVDTRSEKHIQGAMLRLMTGRTSFVIAHRLSTIRDADQILVINDGQIIERGTHEELLAEDGFYHQLYASQFRTHAQTDVGNSHPFRKAGRGCSQLPPRSARTA